MKLNIEKIEALSLVEAALEYAKAGIPVFPCKSDRYGSKKKQPCGHLCPKGFKDATKNQRKIKSWWKKEPDAWIGIPTGEFSGITVIDVDIKGDVDGDEELYKLEKKNGKLPETLVIKTLNGGYHYYYKHETGIKNSTSKVGKGIDVRGDGGYVIAAPSPGYEAYSDHMISPLADWVIHLTKEKIVKLEHKSVLSARTALIPEGQRLEYLKQEAGRMHAGGLPPEAIYAALDVLRDQYCAEGSEGVTDREIENLAWKDDWNRPIDFDVHPEEGEFDIKTPGIDKLYRRRFNPLEWCVEGLVPEGLTMLAGRPKAGKSRLSWTLAHAVAVGDKFLGQFDTEQGKVLYMSLEDTSERMLKDRAKNQLKLSPTPDLMYVTEVPRIDEGLSDWIRQYAGMVDGLKLIVIDTITRVKPAVDRQKRAEYDIEAEIWSTLHALSHKLRVSIIGVYHTNKLKSDNFIDDILGSSGITATFDTIAVLRGRSESESETFSIKGREVKDQSFALKIDEKSGAWSYVQSTVRTQVDDYTLSIWDTIKEQGSPMSLKQLSEKTGKTVSTLRIKLRKMNRDGEINVVDQGGVHLYYLSTMKS